jgi:hypothetical protein
MSEEQRTEETEVEAHLGGKVSRPAKISANDESADDEVEGHVMKVSRPKHS